MIRNIIKRLPPICLGLLSILTVWASTHANPDPHSLIKTDAEDALTSFEVPEGEWITADSHWAFRSEGPLNLNDFNPPSALPETIEKSCDADGHVMHLIRSYMKAVSITAGKTRWAVTDSELRGEAISIDVDGEAIPVFAWIASPADELWTIFMARRIGKTQSPLISLPKDWSLEATRLTNDGSAHCQLLATEGSVADAVEWFRANGDIVGPPQAIQNKVVLEVVTGNQMTTLTFFEPSSDRHLVLLQCSVCPKDTSP